ncbi:MAG: hypothetical protein KAQ92_05065, partial [Candidatus Aenigmarchaeota archaeon]|nr:hypothetical protein [Candidatus Aenigmarchaeota archaeon]
MNIGLGDKKGTWGIDHSAFLDIIRDEKSREKLSQMLKGKKYNVSAHDLEGCYYFLDDTKPQTTKIRAELKNVEEKRGITLFPLCIVVPDEIWENKLKIKLNCPSWSGGTYIKLSHDFGIAFIIESMCISGSIHELVHVFFDSINILEHMRNNCDRNFIEETTAYCIEGYSAKNIKNRLINNYLEMYIKTKTCDENEREKYENLIRNKLIPIADYLDRNYPHQFFDIMIRSSSIDELWAKFGNKVDTKGRENSSGKVIPAVPNKEDNNNLEIDEHLIEQKFKDIELKKDGKTDSSVFRELKKLSDDDEGEVYLDGEKKQNRQEQITEKKQTEEKPKLSKNSNAATAIIEYIKKGNKNEFDQYEFNYKFPGHAKTLSKIPREDFGKYIDYLMGRSIKIINRQGEKIIEITSEKECDEAIEKVMALKLQDGEEWTNYKAKLLVYLASGMSTSKIRKEFDENNARKSALRFLQINGLIGGYRGRYPHTTEKTQMIFEKKQKINKEDSISQNNKASFNPISFAGKIKDKLMHEDKTDSDSELFSGKKEDLTEEDTSVGFRKLFADKGRPVEKEPSNYKQQEYKKVYSSEPKELPNNCIEYKYKYADTDEFAGRVVLYKPSFEYFKKFGYPLKNFVGERGKAFLEEMTNIRENNLNFAGETSLPMIQEFRETKFNDEEFKEKIISTRLRINPITGGFRRLTFMSSVNIGGERFYPNVKFPG